MSDFKKYPLLFEPVYVEIMWGGNLMKKVLDREVPATGKPIGEAWDIVDRENAESIVENGVYCGMSIRELLNHYGEEIVGKGYDSSVRFPLLFKIIDAGKRLSLQVHPDSVTASLYDGAEEKTEMWYILASENDAEIFAGLKSSCTKRLFLEQIYSKEIENCLQKYKSFSGDAYYISAGRVHAIGAGNLILEIQQNSNTTYRLSDWGRVDSEGNSRELHVDQALNCINFADRSTPRITALCTSGKRNMKAPIVSMCPYFKVDDIKLCEPYMDFTNGKSFHVLSAIDSSISLEIEKEAIVIPRGRSCMVPACAGQYTMTPMENKVTTVLRTTL
jgi:mannose-6-phosphate isomerase